MELFSHNSESLLGCYNEELSHILREGHVILRHVPLHLPGLALLYRRVSFTQSETATFLLFKQNQQKTPSSLCLKWYTDLPTYRNRLVSGHKVYLKAKK